MKVVLIANLLSFHSSFNRDNIRILIELGYDVHLISKNDNDSKNLKNFEDYCLKNDVKIHNVNIQRSPYRLFSLFENYKTISRIFSENKFYLVHSHTPVGGLLGRLISLKYSISNVYTAHGFHFYIGAPIFNWLIYFPIEKWLSRLTDVIITINNEDYELAKKWRGPKVYFVPGVGIDYFKYKNIFRDHASEILTVISVGELNSNKNHSFVIESIAKYNINVNYLIAGDGKLKNYLLDRISRLKLVVKPRLLGYVNHIHYLLQIGDIFVFPSKREGLPVSVMEAMASGLPILASDIRGNRDLVDIAKGGYLFKYNNQSDFHHKLNILLNNENLRNDMGRYNKSKARLYDLAVIRKKMKRIYSSFINQND